MGSPNAKQCIWGFMPVLLDVHLKADEDFPEGTAVLAQVGEHPFGVKQHDSTRLGADVRNFKASPAIVK